MLRRQAEGRTLIGTGFKGVRYFDCLEMQGRALKPTIIEMKKKEKKEVLSCERCLQRDLSCLTALAGWYLYLRSCCPVNWRDKGEEAIAE